MILTRVIFGLKEGLNPRKFINLIRGENEDANYDHFGFDLINDCFVNNQQQPLSSPTNPFDLNNNNNNNDVVNVYDPSSIFSFFSCFDGELKGEGEEENDGEHSSGTATTKNADGKPKLKTDRSKTLISERRS
ncbi:hypothetical protein JHK86_004389 [Glycine max]|nr:hypothetical protein JHK86_004389 [Glycine max]